MNKTLIALSAALSLGLVASANAADADIEFKGKITSATCAVSIGGTGTVVNLPSIGTAAANATDEGPRSHAFKLQLGTTSNPCDGTRAEISFTGASLNTAGHLMSSSGTNAVLAIKKGGTAHNLNNMMEITRTGTSTPYSVDLTAVYTKNGSTTITQGAFNGKLPISVKYY